MQAPYTVITGASRGLGAAFAWALARQKRPLVLAARSRAELQGLAHELRETQGVAVECVECDLSSAQGVDTLLQALRELPVDLLINNAGVGMGGPFAGQATADVQAMLQLNVVALTRLCHALLPKLQASQGAIVNIASTAAFQPVPYMAAYAASKAYVLHFSEALQHELAPLGVHVLAVCPGPTATQFFDVAQMDLATTRFKLGPVDVVIEAALTALRKRDALVVPSWQDRIAILGARLFPRRRLTQLAAKLTRREKAQ